MVNLDDGRFQHARLERARFNRCRIRQTDFEAADLAGVWLRRCDLQGSPLTKAGTQRTWLVGGSGDDSKALGSPPCLRLTNAAPRPFRPHLWKSGSVPSPVIWKV